MENIVLEKYKNESVTPLGESFMEIIGYIYSFVSLEKF